MTKRIPSPHRPRVLAPIERVAGLDYDVLDELLGYSLRRAQVAIFHSFYEATRGLGVTPPRFTAMVVVGANPGISQSTLGSVLGIARSGAMTLTDWFEARGWVERRRARSGGRAWGLPLTPRGEKLVAGMKRRVAEGDLKRAASLTAKERRELMGLLGKLGG